MALQEGTTMYYDRNGNPMNVMDWGAAFEDFAGRVVAQDTLPGGQIRVLTVWLGHDHEHDGDDDGPPLIFGSVIQVNEKVTTEVRTPTEDTARQAHRTLVLQAQQILDSATPIRPDQS